MALPQSHDRTAARYQTIVLHDLASLSQGDTRSKTLHRLRIHMRRLQAYLQLIGADLSAERIGECVSRLSRLRTWQVFERYVKRLHASGSDLRTVRDRVEKTRLKLVEKDRYGQIEGLILTHTSPSALAASTSLSHRLAALRMMNAESLAQLIEKACVKPRRKRLHALRLKIKTIRYQEEWALRQNDPRPGLVEQLKDAQDVLGNYEDLAEFRKLARLLGLECRQKITKGWHKVRKRARALPAQLSRLSHALARRHLRLVGSQSRAARASLRSLEDTRGGAHHPP